MIRLILLITLFSFSVSSQATLIDSGLYVTDTDSGLDWLKVPETLNLSVPQVMRELQPGGEFDGWRYASELQLEELLQFGIGFEPTPGCTDRLYCSSDPASLDEALEFVHLFGITNPGSPPNQLKTMGILGDTAAWGGHYVAWIGVSSFNYGYANTRHYGAPPREDYSFRDGGSFLVRDATVSAPSALVLLLTALSFLGIRKNGRVHFSAQ